VRHFWGARATDLLWSGLHCWTVDWAANSTAVESDSILNGCRENGTKSLWSVSAGSKSSFSFSNYKPLWSCFSTIQLFLKPITYANFNQKRHQVMCVDDHKLLFRQTGETNSEARFSLNLWMWAMNRNFLKLVFVSFS